MSRLVVLSDPHLSPTHGFFWQNWTIARDAANAASPDFVIINGDLCIDGPDSDAEMEFAGRAMAGLSAPWAALPGNHDVGDEPPGQDPNQLIDAARLARWKSVFGTDRFARDLGAFRLIGINAQLLGSGLPEEAEQMAWLEAELSATRRPVALFLHKPLFLDSPDEPAHGATTINPGPRAAIMALLARSTVRMVVSGHLHAHRDVTMGGVRYIWLPALTFVHKQGISGAEPMIAAMLFDLQSDDLVVELLHPAGLVVHDLDEIKQHGRWKFLRNMPACPPPGVPLPVPAA